MHGWWRSEACPRDRSSRAWPHSISRRQRGLAAGLGTARHGLAVAAVGKTVYAIGGSTGVGDSADHVVGRSAEAGTAQPQPAAEWRSLPDAPTARLMMAWTVLDDKIWIAGGMRARRNAPNSGELRPEDRRRGKRSLRCRFPCIMRRRRRIAARWWSSAAPATPSRRRRTRFSRSATESGKSCRASNMPGQRRRQRSSTTSSWSSAGRTTSKLVAADRGVRWRVLDGGRRHANAA